MADLIRAIKTIAENAVNRSTWAGVHAYMHAQILKQFEELGQGGSARGVTWAPFASVFYTRKDGTEIPIYGGVKKVLGKGYVKGRLRGEKHRARPGDLLMQSTGILKGAILNDFTVDKGKIVMRTKLKYAGTQDSMRPFNFFAPEEADWIGAYIQRQVTL